MVKSKPPMTALGLVSTMDFSKGVELVKQIV